MIPHSTAGAQSPGQVQSFPADCIHRLLEDGWVAMPGFLDTVLAAGLRREAEALRDQGVLQAARVGQGATRIGNSEVRGDRIAWFGESLSPAQAAFSTAMEQLRIGLNRDGFLGLVDCECHYAWYPPGARYQRHVDRFRDDDRRVVSCVLYLNPGWRAQDGGQLRLYLGEGTGQSVDVLPAMGTLVAFMSDRFPHEVLPALRDRWSIAAWFRRRALKGVL